MGWKDAPIVAPAPAASSGGGWQSAPIVGQPSADALGRAARADAIAAQQMGVTDTAPMPIDELSLPAGANPETDPVIGMDDSGAEVRQAANGAQYILRATQPAGRPAGGYVRAAGRALADDPIGALGAALGAVAGGMYDTASVPGRAAMGDAPTVGDVLGVASMVPMGAPGTVALAAKAADVVQLPPPPTRLMLEDLSRSMATIAERPGFVRGPTSPIGQGGAAVPLGGAGFGGPSSTMVMAPPNALATVANPRAAIVPEIGMADQAATLGQMVAAAKKPGGMKAKELAAGFAVDKSIVDAAEKLGMDLPADVFATNPLIRSVAGLTRGLKGSDTEAKWITSVTNAARVADDVSKKVADSNLSTVSQGVLDTLSDAQRHVAKQAGALYDEVAKAVPPESPIQSPRAVALLEKRAADMGGVDKLSGAEQALLKSLKEGPTYEWVKTNKGSIGNAAFGQVDNYPSFDKALKRRLTVAMGEDMVDAVTQIGGETVGQAARLANRLWEKNKGIQERIVSGFGKDKAGSIAGKLASAISTAANKGDVAGMNKLLKIIPDDMSKEAVWTALMDASRSKGGVTQGGFGFSEFAKLHDGLKRNTAAMKQIGSVVGPDAVQLMDDLAKVSRAVTSARAEVPMTGKANQVLAMLPEGLASKVAKSPQAQSAAVGAAAGFMGPIAGPAIAMAAEAFKGTGKAAPEMVSALLNDPAFLALAVKEAQGLPVVAEAAAVKASRAWKALEALGQAAQSAPARVAVGQGAAASSQPGYMRWGAQ